MNLFHVDHHTLFLLFYPPNPYRFIALNDLPTRLESSSEKEKDRRTTTTTTTAALNAGNETVGMESSSSKYMSQPPRTVSVRVVSGGMHDGDYASIQIDNVEYCSNQRGMNVRDIEHLVFRSSNIDTH